LAYQILFHTSAKELFGELFEKVEMEMRQRAKELLYASERLPGDLRAKRKIEHLKRLSGN
jgi:hypothetical protein